MNSLLVVFLISALICASSAATGPTVTCGTAFNGSYVDLSPLFASTGGYLLVNSTGIVDAAHGYPNPQPVATYEIQVCANVVSQFSACTVASPANVINVTTGECTPIGDITTSAWDVAPSNAGVYITYYHGAPNSRTTEYASRIYFECDPTATSDSPMIFEHQTSRGEFHFTMSTAYACTSSSSSTSTGSASTTGSGTTTGGGAVQPTITCGREFNGSFVDLSPLFASNGSYFILNTPGDLSPAYGAQPPLSVELQICANIGSSQFSQCTVPSPANVFNSTSGECIYTGDITTAAWDVNPELDGVNLVYFHGQLNGRVYQASTRIYFICDPSAELSDSQFTYEHVTALGEYHWDVRTKYACPDDTTATTSTSSTSAGASTSTSTTTSASSFVAPSVVLAVVALVAVFAF